MLAGAGIFNGVTKLVAQHHDDPPRLKQVVGTSSAMVLGFSTAGAGIFTGGGADKPGAVRPYALSGAGTPGGAGADGGSPAANFLLALMKGFRDAAGNAFSLIAGSLIGVAAYYACYVLGGYQGALLGLALVPALVVVPAGIMLWRRGNIPLSALRPRWDNGLAGQLSKFHPDGADNLR